MSSLRTLTRDMTRHDSYLTRDWLGIRAFRRMLTRGFQVYYCIAVALQKRTDTRYVLLICILCSTLFSPCDLIFFRMRPVIFLSVFLVVTYCREALSEELIRQQPSQDFVKLISSKKQIAKRRFRRDVQHEEDPDTFNTNTADGLCRNPTIQAGRDIQKMPVSKLRRALFIDEGSKKKYCFRFCAEFMLIVAFLFF